MNHQWKQLPIFNEEFSTSYYEVHSCSWRRLQVAWMSSLESVVEKKGVGEFYLECKWENNNWNKYFSNYTLHCILTKLTPSSVKCHQPKLTWFLRTWTKSRVSQTCPGKTYILKLDDFDGGI